MRRDHTGRDGRRDGNRRRRRAVLDRADSEWRAGRLQARHTAGNRPRSRIRLSKSPITQYVNMSGWYNY